MLTRAPIPKPAPRQKKPRKPLRRSTAPISRKSRPAKTRQTPRGKEAAALDRLWSRMILLRDESCQIRMCNPGPSFTLMPREATEAAHIIGKGRQPKLRWHILNGVGACHRCHAHFTVNPEAWDRWCEQNLPITFKQLTDAAIYAPSPDRGEVRFQLTRQIKALAGPAA